MHGNINHGKIDFIRPFLLLNGHFKRLTHWLKFGKFFFFEFQGDESDIDLHNVDDEEFREYFWVDPNDIVNKTINFRKSIYKKLVKYFEDNFKK